MAYKKVIFITLLLLLSGFVFSQNSEPILKIQYRCAETNSLSNQIKPHIRLINTGIQAVELSDLKVRYFFTLENPVSQRLWIDYARIGSENVKGEFIQVNGSEYYLEITFTQNAGLLYAGQDSGEIQLRFHKTNWTNYDQSDDYSFDPGISFFADFNKIYLYENNILVWGEQKSDINIDFIKTEWFVSLSHANGLEFGHTFLDLEGRTNAERLTVRTWRDGVPQDIEMAIDLDENFAGKVEISFTHNPDAVPFIVNTIITGYRDTDSRSIEIQSPELQYKQPEWIPYYANEAEITISENNYNETVAKITLQFSNSGFKVEEWGSVAELTNFSADAEVYKWTGASNPVLTEISHSYNLGKLTDGNYEFQFKTWGIDTAVKEFTIDHSVPPPLDLKVLYKCMDRSAQSNSIRAHFNIVNDGTESVALNELELRYYYTLENPFEQEFHCDYARMGSGNVSGNFTNTDADNYYLSLTFASGWIDAGSQSGEIQIRWNKTNWTQINQADDHSFNQDFTAFAEWENSALFHNERLVWGLPIGDLPIPPQVSITNPLPGTEFNAGQIIPVTAAAFDNDGEIVKVEFYLDNTLLTDDFSFPYTYDLQPDIGTHQIQAIAYDNDGLSSQSDIVTISVYSTTPGINISRPALDAVFLENDVIAVETEIVNITIGLVEKVEFFADSVKIAEDNTQPFSIAWTPSVPDDYELSVKMHYGGQVFDSNPVPIRVMVRPPHNFVSRQGNRLSLDNKTFYYNGTNQYYLFYKSNAMIDEVIEDAAALGLTVIRTWGFCDGELKDGYGFQPEPGIYHESTFAKFDYVIHKASRHGIRLVIPFVNYWDDMGGMSQYVTWSATAGSKEDFYTDIWCRDTFKSYIEYFLNRINTITGVAYKDDPTIMMWELANEPRCNSDSSGEKLQNWIDEMAAFIKNIDSNHLLSTGSEGFYNSNGVDYIKNHGNPHIDVCSFHLYPYHWHITEQEALDYIQSHVTDAHNILNKPAYLGEFGWNISDGGIEKRDRIYTDWFNLLDNVHADGAQFWILSGHRDDGKLYPDYDGFTTYYPEHSTTSAIIADYSAKMLAKSAIIMDITLPEIFITSHADQQIVSDTVLIFGTASDNNELAKIEVAFNDGAYRPVLGTSTWSYSWDTANAMDVRHKITVKATDTQGNTRSTSIWLKVSNGSGNPGDWELTGRKHQDDGYWFVYFVYLKNLTGEKQAGNFKFRFYLKPEGSPEVKQHYEQSNPFISNPITSDLQIYYEDFKYYEIDMGFRDLENSESIGYKGNLYQQNGGFISANDWSAAEFESVSGNLINIAVFKDGRLIFGFEP